MKLIKYIVKVLLLLLLEVNVSQSQTLYLYIRDSLFVEPGTIFWAELRVNGFQGIASGQFTVGWDSTHLTLLSAVPCNIPGIIPNSMSNRVITAWTEPNGTVLSLPDSACVLRLQFRAGNTSPVFTDIGFPDMPLETSFYQFDGNTLLNTVVQAVASKVAIRRCNTKIFFPTAPSFCTNDSLRLNAQCFNCQSFKWDNGSTDPFRTITKPGFVFATASGPLRCYARDSTEILEKPIPSFSLPATLPICPQTSAPLRPQTSQTNYTYAWSTGQQTKTITVFQPGVYSLTATNAEGCSSADTTEVVESGPTWMELVAAQPNCRQTLGRIEIAQIKGGAVPFLYDLNGQGFRTDPLFTDLAPGTYQAVVQDADGCEYRDTVTLRPAFIPAVTIAPVPTLLEAGDSIQLRAQPAPGYPLDLIQKVAWSPLETLRFQGNMPNGVWMPVAKPPRDTWYKITITSKDLCTASDSVLLRVRDDQPLQVYLPNVFAPDANGDNARFTAFSTDPRLVQIERMRVYDRWGNLVFEKQGFLANSAKQGWDGNSNTGRPLETGLYVYSIEFKTIEGEFVSNAGEVTLLR